MKKQIYQANNGYIYSYITGKLFFLSDKGRKIVEAISDEKDLYTLCENEEITKEEYGALFNLLFSRKSLKVDNDLAKLQLVITNACNMKCTYCYEQKGCFQDNAKNMTLEMGKEIIDYFFEKYRYIQAISFFGGEPFLNGMLIEEICAYLEQKYKNRYGTLYMMSNFYDVSDRNIEMIKRYNIRLTVSLDGNKVVNINRITKKGEETFEKVSNNIERSIRVCKQPEAIEATLSGIHNRNGWTETDVAKYLNSKFGIKYCSTVPANGYDDEYKTEENALRVKNAMSLYIKKGIVTDIMADVVKVLSGSQCNELFCSAGIKQYTVMPNGDIYPCQIYAGLSSNEYCFGNIMKMDKEQWNNVTKRMLELNEKKKICEGCEIAGFCTPCIGAMVCDNHNLKDGCLQRKKYIEDIINALAEIYVKKDKWNALVERLKGDKKEWSTI